MLDRILKERRRRCGGSRECSFGALLSSVLPGYPRFHSAMLAT
jgi:hypothetical protein